MSLWNLLPVGAVFALLQVTLRFNDDRDVARRLRARDPRVMSVLYDRYGKVAFSIIFRIVRDSAVAEDLLQETFLRVWNRAPSFDEERGALGAWILTVARNRAIDHLRSIEGRMAAGTMELDRLDNPARFSNFDDTALSIDRARRLKNAIEKLNANQRTAIELAYYEGLSQTEMAEKLKQPLGTVKTWVRTALKLLREELGEATTA